jgi:hypothetical protein
MYMAGREVASIGRLRRLERLSIVRHEGYEGLELRFSGAKFGPLSLQTKPEIKLSWDVDLAGPPDPLPLGQGTTCGDQPRLLGGMPPVSRISAPFQRGTA